MTDTSSPQIARRMTAGLLPVPFAGGPAMPGWSSAGLGIPSFDTAGGRDVALIAELNDLLQLDCDAVGAYTLAIAALRDGGQHLRVHGERGDGGAGGGGRGHGGSCSGDGGRRERLSRSGRPAGHGRARRGGPGGRTGCGPTASAGR